MKHEVSINSVEKLRYHQNKAQLFSIIKVSLLLMFRKITAVFKRIIRNPIIQPVDKMQKHSVLEWVIHSSYHFAFKS